MEKMKTIVGIEKVIKKDLNKSLLVGWEKKVRFEAGKGIKNYAGGPSQRVSRLKSPISQEGVISSLERSGRPVFSRPIEKYQTKEWKDVFENYMKSLTASGKEKSFAKRAINRAISIFRKPFLKSDFRKESPQTIARKGFSRPAIATAQTSKNINAWYEDYKK